MAEARDYRAIGTRPVRPDGVDKVTGRANFGADLNLPNMIHGKVLRSPHAHARIKNIDATRALQMPGVYAVVSGADFPAGAEGEISGEGGGTVSDLAKNVMARDKVLYHGHAVAAVAAQTAFLGESALELIDVEYEVLPAVLDVDAAMAEGAPLVDDNQRTPGSDSDAPSNIAAVTKFERGDPEAGFAEADVVVEGDYRVPTAHQGYIEPHACTASLDEQGRATVWCCTQGHFDVRSMTAGVLGKSVGEIKVTPSEIGGGFGGKTVIYLEPVAVKLSEVTGRPVKMVMSREEVFRATGPTSASHCRIKVGARRDGTITAATAWLAYEAGAFAGAPVGPGSMSVFAPYDLENFRIEGFDVLVNKPKVAAYRAPGAPQSMHAMESALDEVARKIGMDPIDLRLKNCADEGTQAPYGPIYPPIGIKKCLEAAKVHPNYTTPKAEGTGRGIAAGFWFQHRHAVERRSQAVGRRHGDGDGRQSGHRWLAGIHVPDGGGNARRAVRCRARPCGRYGIHRFLQRHRRKPNDVRHRSRGRARLRGHHRRVQAARGCDLGYRRGPGGLDRRPGNSEARRQHPMSIP